MMQWRVMCTLGVTARIINFKLKPSHDLSNGGGTESNRGVTT